jgi:DMSO/TMAO reductase YedYZ heme-binding membrane subunit
LKPNARVGASLQLEIPALVFALARAGNTFYARGVQRRAVILNLVKVGLCVWCVMPAVTLWQALEHRNRHFIRAYDYQVLTLGIAETGAWAFIFLFIALACTPVQQITGLRWPGELRRLFGLFACFYSFLHFCVYMVIGQKLHWNYLWPDALGQTSRIPGWFALLLLLPLAVTSTDGMIRRLGAKRWKNLHRLVYLATALAITHLALTDKENQTDYHRTKNVVVPFLILMLLRVVPLSSLRKKLQKTRPARPSPEG